MRNTWKPDKFTPTDIKTKIDDKIFTAPIYQRGKVWKDKQRATLVDSIKKGLPFGALLLFKEGEKYQIIDGLQRSLALVSFVENPAQFFNSDDIDNNAIDEIIKLAGAKITTEECESIKSSLISWVKSLKTLHEVQGMQFYDFGVVLAEKSQCFKSHEKEIADIIKPMLQEFQKLCASIQKVEVPAIIMEGDSRYLPTVFQRINSEGTLLSDYQLYAATWLDHKYRIANDNTDLDTIVKINRDRYDAMFDGKASIDNYDSTIFYNKRELNTFEIAFGFGKLLCQKWPELFHGSNNDTSIESVGFTLINACLGQKYTDADNMHIVLEREVGNNNINVFLCKLIDTISFVSGKISKFSKFKLNSRQTISPLHSEMQICAIIASIFLLQYATIKLDESDKLKSFDLHLDYVCPEWNSKYKFIVEENLSKLYIIEILQKYWSSSLNTKLDQVITNNHRYAQEIDCKTFLQAVDNWYQNMNIERREASKVPNPKTPELLLLSTIYMNSFSANNQLNDSKFDVEHLAPKAKMRERLLSYGPDTKLPISSFGNLCILPQYENRSKGKKTLYEDQKYLNKINLTDIEKEFSFTTQEDLKWILNDSLSKEDFCDAYKTFIDARFNKIKKMLEDNYSNI